MNKIMKQLSALALALVLALALCVPAFATSSPASGANKVAVTPGAAANVTVGVSNPENKAANGGDNLLAYKVVDIAYADGRLSYSFSKLFRDFQTATGGTLTTETYSELTSDSTELKTLLGSFTAYVMGLSTKPAADYTAKADSNGVAAFTMGMGQYIVLGDGTSNGARIYQTVTAEVVPFIEDGKSYIYDAYTVSMKTTTPSINKNITAGTVADGDKQTASVGDEITYTLTIAVPVYPEGATNKTFFVGDLLSKGLALNMDSITVADKDNTAIKGFTKASAATAEGKTQLYIDFDYDAIARYANQNITVTYTAKLTDKAEVGAVDGNPNNVTLIYSNSPFNGNTWKPSENPENPPRPDDKTPGYGKDEDVKIVYTYALVIDKFEEKHEDEKLSGAVFEIYNNAELSGDPIATITTDANGAAMYKGLEKGTYWLKETIAPANYNLLDKPVEITIDGTNTPYTTTKDTTVTHYTYATAPTEGQSTEQAKINGAPVWMNSKGEVATGAAAPEGYSAAYVKEVKKTVEQVIEVSKIDGGANGYYKAGIANNTGAQLPSTGGVGTTIFYIIGGILMVGAVVLLITKRRVSSEK